MEKEGIDLFKTWNGKALELAEEVIPLDMPQFEYSNDFVKNFNENPVETFIREKQKNKSLSNECYAGPYIFHCKGLTATAVSNLIFDHQFPLKVQPFLFFFFSSITLDYMQLHEALLYCIPRIALPDNYQQFNTLVTCFANAYKSQNPYVSLKQEQLTVLVKASIFTSGYRVSDTKFYPKDKFHVLVASLNLTSETEDKLYNQINKHPIPLFFTFASTPTAPNYEKKGMLKKKGGMFKSMKNRYFVIDDFLLKYYSDQTGKQQIGELEIGGTISVFIPKQKKDEMHLLIKNKDGTSIGFKISKKDGIRKKSNHNDYVAYSDKESDIKEWQTTLNLVSFWKPVYDSLLPSSNQKK